MPSFCKLNISYLFSDSKIKDKLLSLDSNKVIFTFIFYTIVFIIIEIYTNIPKNVERKVLDNDRRFFS